MDLLKRQLAPITSEAWDQIDDEAKRVLALHLAGRKLVDFSGPHGWQLGGVNTGRLQQIAKGPVPEVGHAIRGSSRSSSCARRSGCRSWSSITPHAARTTSIS